MDEILDHFGPWHYPMYLLNALGGFSYTWRVMAMQFMAPKDLRYWCARPNDSISLEEWRTLNEGVDLRCYTRDHEGPSNVSVRKCDSWEYDHSYHVRTLTEEWDAVCGREWLLSYSQSLLMAGNLGSLVFFQISDWYGRRRAVLLSYLLTVITGFAVATTSTFWTFSVARAINFAVTISVSTYAVECVGAKKRAGMVMIGELRWLTGLITFPLVTYFVRDWRWIQIISTMPEIFWLIYTIYLDESPKWLISSGRYDEATKLVGEIASRNGLRNINEHAVINKAREKIDADRAAHTRANLVDLFRGYTIARTTAVCVLNDTTQAFLYYYLLYYTVDLGSNPYLNLVFTFLTEAPATLMAYFVLKYVKRKSVYSITYMISVVSLAALFLPSNSIATQMTLASIAKLSGQTTWTILGVHNSEVFPTPVRSIAGGFVRFMSRLGTITAPLMHPLNGTAYGWIPIALTIGMCLVSWIATFALPETFGHNLPDTFHESKIQIRRANYL